MWTYNCTRGLKWLNSLKHLGVDPDRLSFFERFDHFLKCLDLVSLIVISALMTSINFLVLIFPTMQSLSSTVGNVEFPIAASSGRQASLYNKSNASLWLRSTKQFVYFTNCIPSEESSQGKNCLLTCRGICYLQGICSL